MTGRRGKLPGRVTESSERTRAGYPTVEVVALREFIPPLATPTIWVQSVPMGHTIVHPC